jgi:hypothetical protein
MCIEAGLSPRLVPQVLWAVDGSFVGYEGIQGGFERLWMSGAGSAEEPGLLQRHAQGCVERLRGLEVPNLPLSDPTGVQSSLLHLRRLVEGACCEDPRPGRLILTPTCCGIEVYPPSLRR